MNEIVAEVKHWYVVQVMVGFEKSVREHLLERIEQQGMHEQFGEILLPVERVLEIRSGKKKITERKLYPGYLFLEIAADTQNHILAECWHLVRKTPRIGHFISGATDAPAPLPKNVIEKIRAQMGSEDDKDLVVRAQFVMGDQVRIKDGPFSDFSGTVDSVNAERSRLTVLVMVFGRSTPVELDFSQVDKI